MINKKKPLTLRKNWFIAPQTRNHVNACSEKENCSLGKAGQWGKWSVEDWSIRKAGQYVKLVNGENGGLR